MKAHELLPSRGGLALPACEGASRLQPAAVWALLSEGFLPSSARKAEIAPPTGAHHKTSNLVGAGEEAGRVGVHLLVLQPWGRAVGGLPAQGLPEAVCEGRWHQSPIDTITPPSPPPSTSPQTPGRTLLSVPTLHLQVPGGQRRKGPEGFKGDETEAQRGQTWQ